MRINFLGIQSSRSFSFRLLFLFTFLTFATPRVGATDWEQKGEVRRESIPGSVRDLYEEIKRLSLSKSPEIQAGDANLMQKKYQIWTSVARWLPSVSAQLNYANSLNNQFLVSGALGNVNALGFKPQETRLYGWNLTGTFPLLKRSVILAFEQSLAEKKLAELQLITKKNEMDWRLRQLLGAYLVSLYREEAIKNSLMIAETHRKDAELRFEQGQATRVDVLRAEANLVSLQSKGFTYRQQCIAARAEFMEYSGLNAEDLNRIELEEFLKGEGKLFQVIEDFTESSLIFNPIKEFLAEDSATELKRQQRLTQVSSRYQVALSQGEVSMTQAKGVAAQDWPDLSFQANANNQGANLSTAFNHSTTISWSWGVYLTIPLNPGVSFLSTQLQARQGERVSEIQSLKEMAHLRNEVETDRVRILALLKMLESLKWAVAQQEEISRLSEKTYKLGKTTMVELLSSQNDLIESRISLAQTKVDFAALIRKMAWNLGVIVE